MDGRGRKGLGIKRERKGREEREGVEGGNGKGREGKGERPVCI